MRPTIRQLVATTSVLALLAGLVPRAFATIYTVDCTTTSLQTVLNGTTKGDTVDVSGTCTGNFTIDTAITLQGWATLDGNGSGTVLTVTVGPSDTVMLTDLNIINGYVGGVVLTPPSAGTLALNVVNVTDNDNFEGPYFVGGGILNASTNGGAVTITNSTIAYNEADGGGGIGNLGNGTVSVTGCSVKDNEALEGGGIGDFSGIEGVTVYNSSITDNIGFFAGGGIASEGVLSITNSSISQNQSFGDGGGIAIDDEATILNSSITSNFAGAGGGIYSDGTISVTSSNISKNTAEDNGGGIDNFGSGSLTKSSVQKNTASNGGGIFNESGSTPITVSSDSSVSKNTPNNIAP
jgi:hypothetical protein